MAANEPVKDWRGTAIEAGDTILYAVTAGSWIGINEATVTAVGLEPAGSWSDKEQAVIRAEWQRGSDSSRAIKTVKLTSLRTVTVVAKNGQEFSLG